MAKKIFFFLLATVGIVFVIFQVNSRKRIYAIIPSGNTLRKIRKMQDVAHV